jgi:pimeloyl-ACP methyl ester carboxylesterase
MQFTRGGIQLAYEEAGSGVPVVLLHGFPFSRRMWRPQASLARTVRLITPDLRGFGESGGTPISVDEFADDVHALVEHLKLSTFVLGGFSMGGYVLFRYVARHADRVQAVLLLDTRAEADTPEGRQRRYEAIARIEREGPAGYLDDFLGLMVSPKTVQSRPALVQQIRAQMESARPATLTGALRAMAERPDSTPVLSAIHVPTLIVVGEDDKATPPDSSRKMHAAIAGSQLVIIPEAGHTSNLEQPERFNTALASFLAVRR